MTLSAPSAVRHIIAQKVVYGPNSTLLEFDVNLNQAPLKVALSAPENDAILLATQQPTFTWQVPVDPEDNPLDFQIQIDYTPTFDSQAGSPALDHDSHLSKDGFSFANAVPSGTGQASFQPLVLLDMRRAFYWRVRAYDGKRYGEWSDAWKVTIGVLATKVVLATDRNYLPAAGTTATLTATFKDRLDNVDTNYNSVVIFTHTQPTIGTIQYPSAVVPVNGVATAIFTSSGVLGATFVELVFNRDPLPCNELILRSIVIGEIPVLLEPPNGKRLASKTKPRLVWLVPDDPQDERLHFKVEIYSSPVMIVGNLIYAADSRLDYAGFSFSEPVLPLSPPVYHDVQIELPDGKYWWRVTPYDTAYKVASEPFAFSFPNEMVVVSKALRSAKPVTQAVMMANVIAETGNGTVPAEVKHYVTNMALEPDELIVWEEVTERVKTRSKYVFKATTVPEHGFAIAIKTVVKANDALGQISVNGHGIVFDGDYSETANEDYIGVLSAITPIGFSAVPADDGQSIALSWAYVDLNVDSRKVVDKFIIEVFNAETGRYEPYDGGTGEVSA